MLLALGCAILLTVCSTAAERWRAGADTDDILAAAIGVAGIGSGTPQAARVSSILRPRIEYYPVAIAFSLLFRLLALSIVFYGAFGVIDAGLTFGAIFAAGAYAMLAASIARIVMTIGLLSSDRPTVEELLSGDFLSANLAAILPADTPAWLVAAGRTIDSLTIIYLLVFIAVLGELRVSRVSEKTIAVVVAIAFVLWLIVRVAWAAVFGS